MLVPASLLFEFQRGLEGSFWSAGVFSTSSTAPPHRTIPTRAGSHRSRTWFDLQTLRIRDVCWAWPGRMAASQRQLRPVTEAPSGSLKGCPAWATAALLLARWAVTGRILPAVSRKRRFHCAGSCFRVARVHRSERAQAQEN